MSTAIYIRLLEELSKGVNWDEAVMDFWFEFRALGVEKIVNGEVVNSRGVVSNTNQNYANLFETLYLQFFDGNYRVFLRQKPNEEQENAIKFLEKVDSLLHDHERLKTEAVKDVLTGCYNRKGLQDWFDERTKRYSDDIGFVLALFDLDNFKELNDTHGHAKGDEALIEVANAFKKSLRTYDMVARLGGDEFVVILETSSCHKGIKDRLQAIVDTVPLQQYGCTMSMGVVCYPTHANKLEELLAQADALMYRGKHSGKNKIVLWDGECGC